MGEDREVTGAGGGNWATAMRILEDMEQRGAAAARAEPERGGSRRVRISEELQGASGRRGGSRRHS